MSFSFREIADAKGIKLVVEEGSTIIPENAFESRKDIYSVDFPDTLKTIEFEAFYNAGIETLELPSSTQEIGEGAFSMNNLNELKIENLTLSTLPNGAFGRNELTSVDLPETLQRIEESVFEMNKLKSINLPEPLEYIGWDAFRENQLETLRIPGNVRTIDLRAFEENQLTSVFIPNSVEIIKDHAFEDNLLSNVELPYHFKDNPPINAFDNDVTLTFRPESYKKPETSTEVKGTRKDDRLKGTINADYVIGKIGDDVIRGAKGDDVLIGGKGEDVLYGSKGDDYLNGSKQDDILYGQKGADVFQISKGLDIVKDFSIDQGDRIALDKEGKYTIIEHVDGVLIEASSKKQLLLEGADFDDLETAGIDLFVQPV